MNPFHTVPTSQFGPRLGRVTLQRPTTGAITLDTPALTVGTSRGVVPHLSRDHHVSTAAVQWVNIPFGSFLEHNPPLPTLQSGPLPLHSFLGFHPANQIISMSARDPADLRELPPNGNTNISVCTVRGVRKITQTTWRAHALTCNPDFVEALSDVPLTAPPHSQKRLTKSIARSTAWLGDFIRPGHHPNILLHLVGGTVPAARTAFAEGIIESLYGKDADNVSPYKSMDEAVSGYIFDTAPLRLALDAEAERDLVESSPSFDFNRTPAIASLLTSSLAPLPSHKLRIVNSSISPHEMLYLIQNVGIDLFDANWAQKAADIGIALDFAFPATVPPKEKKWNIGHNLYDVAYAYDFSRLATSFRSAGEREEDTPICSCAACSPVAPTRHLIHSALDVQSFPSEDVGSQPMFLPPSTRAYLHHLLHTHEMGAHALLVMHNLTVLNAFFTGIRQVLNAEGAEGFGREVDRFIAVYDEDMHIFDQAKVGWAEVDKARGRGKMAREREKDAETEAPTVVV